ncbi:MAG: PhoPQ-activated pathogenicity-related family protein [Planctomycetes bacterium]|nr:PhoPQ-activated pathogenicity-related family protein [Planctomycetota bacterium]
MISLLRKTACQALVLFAASRAVALDPPPYVLATDETYKWTEKTTTPFDGGEITVLRLTSQTWHGMKWRHWMHVIKPAKVTHPDQAMLVIAGGSNSKKEPGAMTMEVGFVRDIAVRTGSVIAIVEQVPNEPIFGGKDEDEILAYTFQQFLETKDESWPALLPMTKSVMRAMDATQAFVKQKFDLKIEKFVVTGASKRGWTTWLTAAFDNRVEAIAPMVIDTLNMPRQMKLQIESFGGFSEQIKDYTDLDLPRQMAGEDGKRLVQLIDPYAYIERLTMPKLIVLGTNDRYWPVDAVKLYYGDLKGEKHIHYCPNAGHGLGPGVIEAVAAFYSDVLDGRERPKFDWKTEVAGGDSVTTLTASTAPIKVELWSAASETRDFRDSKWAGVEIAGDKGTWEARVKVPESGFAVYHLRMTYKAAEGQEYALCTNSEVIGSKK